MTYKISNKPFYALVCYAILALPAHAQTYDARAGARARCRTAPISTMITSLQMRDSNNIRERVSLLLTVVRESLEHGAGSRELVGYVVSSERREGVWIEVEPPHPLLPLQGLGQHSIYCPPHYL